jgi:hypothetical protein
MAGLVPAIHVLLNFSHGGRPRAWKVRLIHAMNPDWDDLYNTLI